MKKMIYTLMLLPTVFIFGSCNTGDAPQRSYSIVFCDFTSSVDTLESIRKIKKDAIEILAKEGTDNNVEFFVINKNINSACVFKNTPLIFNPRPSQRMAFEGKLKQQMDSLSRLLDIASSKASEVYRKEPNSCIIDCIERAITYFRNYDPDPATKLHLYILSDMLECCTFGKKGIINLETVKDIESQIKLIPLVADSTLSFRVFKNAEIHIVMSTNRVLEDKRGFKTFWEKVFQRYGYDIRNRITVELPRNFKDQK